MLLGLAMLALPLAATAQSSTMKLNVSVTIVKHASLKAVAWPGPLVITAADVARGYVEVSSPAQLAIKSNSPSGYMLVFANQGDFVRQTRISGLGTTVQLGAGGGVVTQAAPGRGMNEIMLALSFRFELAPQVQQGVYPWPLQVSVTPM
jgi:hypothetical protein